MNKMKKIFLLIIFLIFIVCAVSCASSIENNNDEDILTNTKWVSFAFAVEGKEISTEFKPSYTETLEFNTDNQGILKIYHDYDNNSETTYEKYEYDQYEFTYEFSDNKGEITVKNSPITEKIELYNGYLYSGTSEDAYWVHKKIE
jgi:hypothetical protein